jgi:hypothetical protein
VRVKYDKVQYNSIVQLKALCGVLADDWEGVEGVPVIAFQRETVPTSQVTSRLVSFGELGVACIKRLERAGIVSRARGLLQQRVEVESLMEMDQALAAAYSLMYCEVVIQVDGGDNLTNWLYDTAMGMHVMSEQDMLACNNKLDLEAEKQFKYFPVKKHPAVQNRTNVWFSEVYQSMQKFRPHALKKFEKYAGLIEGVTNDQAAACLMYFNCLYGADVENAAIKSMLSIKYPQRTKHASVAIKSLGLQYRRLAAMLVEGDTMQGRGSGDTDLEEVMSFRCSKELESTLLHVNKAQLSEILDEIYEEEIDVEKYSYEPVDSFWSRRWVWGVNGSHNKVLQRHEKEFVIDLPGLKQLHRRVYLEEVESNPLDTWSGKVYVSCIKKLENGKTRPLQSIDSNSYICSEHLLGPVERAWRGVRCILDPGQGGTVRMSRRMRSLAGQDRDAAKLMIDYAAYDSQHTLLAQKLVVERLCIKVGYPKWMTERLVASFDKNFIFVNGKCLGVAKGTLMSGHRMTTFINTVLNLAYLRMFCPTIRQAKSMHVGDDVFCVAPDLKTAAEIAMELNASPIEAKAEKQSLGTISGEFLRMCSRGNVTRGYVARAVAASIMGQWTSENRLDPGEALQTMVTAGWTIANRAADVDAGLVLYATVCRISKIRGDEALVLLKGASGLNDGPSRMMGMVKHRIRINFKTRGKVRLEHLRKAYGVRDYLSRHLSEVERNTLARAEISAMGEMAEASYQKSEHDVANYHELEEHEVVTAYETDAISPSRHKTQLCTGNVFEGCLNISWC